MEQQELERIRKGMLRLWVELPHGTRSLIRANLLMWAQISWVNVLHLWYQITGTRRAAIGMGVGCLASATYLFQYVRRVTTTELERMAYQEALEALRQYVNGNEP